MLRLTRRNKRTERLGTCRVADPAFLDLRPLQTPSGPPGACKLRRGKMVIRDPATVDTILGHQTAVTFGVSKEQIRRAGGDAMLAQFMRARNVHAHCTAFDEGTYALAYPVLAYVYHGNLGSGRSVALESEGLFNGYPNDKRNRGEPSDLLIETSRAACTMLVDECAKLGATIRFYDAHRKHASSRRGDPGWKLWHAVYVDHCERRLGLQPLRGTTRTGKPIPESWDAREVGIPY